MTTPVEERVRNLLLFGEKRCPECGADGSERVAGTSMHLHCICEHGPKFYHCGTDSCSVMHFAGGEKLCDRQEISAKRGFR